MLSCDEQADLAAALVATAETLGQEMSANAAKLMAKDLAEYPGEAIRSALQACRRELTGKLTLAAILQRVQAVDGRPEPNEAWALALEASDERATVVLTPEIQEALTIAAPILEARDKVGARMAFISAYERAVSRSRREALPVEWRVSLGHDEAGRQAGIQKAAALNRLPAAEVARLEGWWFFNCRPRQMPAKRSPGCSLAMPLPRSRRRRRGSRKTWRSSRKVLPHTARSASRKRRTKPPGGAPISTNESTGTTRPYNS